MPVSGTRKRDIKPVSFLWRDHEVSFMPVIGTVFPDGHVECLYGMVDWFGTSTGKRSRYVFRDTKLMDE